MKHPLALITALLLAPLGITQAAEIKLASVFAPNAVLQRDKPVPVWGWADAHARVTVEFAGQKKDATADAGGKWSVALGAFPANAAPASLTVSAPPAKPISIAGLVVGDVFLCAGGSEVGKRGTELDATPDDPKMPPVRVFAVSPSTAREPQADVKGRWMPAVSSGVKGLPAQAFHLGRTLAAENKVPVGIVSISIGNPAECWMSREALTATPEAVPILAFYASDAWKQRTVGTYEERLNAWMEIQRKLPLNPPPKPKQDEGDTLAKQEPASVWNACVAPLVPMALRGVVWDGGEDWVSQCRAFQQGQLLPAMIADWRRAFGGAAMPFIVVELRPHRYAVPFGIDGRLAAELRDAQRSAAAKAKATIVTTIDFPADPAPREVATRIADAIQGRDNSGPVLARSETQGDKIVLHFTNTRGGLKTQGGELKGFAIASSLYRWVWADTKIEGDTIIVSAPTVSKPDGVRYAYEDLPSRGATLTDGEGHPAAPFRTDTHFAVTDLTLDPGAGVLRYNPRVDFGMEDPRLPRVLIIGDSISGHYLYELREIMHDKANVIGESSVSARYPFEKYRWSYVSQHFYRSDYATKDNDLKNFLAEQGPFDIVHFNNGSHNFSHANPGDEKPYAEQLRKVVATIRASGAVCLFANSTGTVADNTIPKSPRYL
ncbi:MAG: hypothetical protein NTV80_27170, partial [Verrucomicrobia bacterium]|nr:hypothetical protein [Verrucomicrobiota bacterium]